MTNLTPPSPPNRLPVQTKTLTPWLAKERRRPQASKRYFPLPIFLSPGTALPVV